MVYSEQELSSAIRIVRQQAPAHTGFIIGRRVKERKVEFDGASCVYIQHRSHVCAVTCEHVVRFTDSLYILLIPQSPKPALIDLQTKTVAPAKLLLTNPELDLAVLDISSVDFQAAGKSPYALQRSAFVDEDWAKEELIGTASFIYGAWGNFVRRMPFGESNMFVETPFYSAGGPIVAVTKTTIIADFSENRELFRNTADFPQLKAVRISGGSRDLSGTSGSGLWVVVENQVCLVGILKGAEEKVGDPRIRFIPVWQLRGMLERSLFE